MLFQGRDLLEVMSKLLDCYLELSEFELQSPYYVQIQTHILRNFFILPALGGGLRGVMVKTLACGIIVSEFEPQLHSDVHFRTNTIGRSMNLLILPAMG